MSIGSTLTNTGAAIGRQLDRVRLRRRQQLFAAKVVEALAELGLRESELDGRVQALLAQVCRACYERDREQANATALALEFFVRLALEYPNLVERAMKSEGVFVGSIGVIRAWHGVGRIAADMAETSIARIKDYLVAQLRSMDDTDDDRMLAEFQIREL
ncbi:MAG TPA: hypothetical protein VGM74_02050 [Burkholderiaceae bacterium]|jgi:hypothetical protein